ncbi:MAG: response regulator [Gemmatimonadota bacterium]|jgi:CheY-like chemotaxis protein
MSGQNRVMFVDDEEGVRVSWDRVLSEKGFNVKTAVDGATAISELKDHPVDVVVADWRMPVMDGLQLLEWIQGEQPETRFILLTGYGNDEVEQKARELGAYEYLNKPISPETLAAVVTAAVNLKLIPDLGVGPVEQQVEPAVQEVEPTVEEAVVEAEPALQEAEPAASAEAVQRSGWEVAGSLIAAPLMGLAFVLFLPVIGFAALFWSLGGAIKGAVRPSKSRA